MFELIIVVGVVALEVASMSDGDGLFDTPGTVSGFEGALIVLDAVDGLLGCLPLTASCSDSSSRLKSASRSELTLASIGGFVSISLFARDSG